MEAPPSLKRIRQYDAEASERPDKFRVTHWPHLRPLTAAEIAANKNKGAYAEIQATKVKCDLIELDEERQGDRAAPLAITHHRRKLPWADTNVNKALRSPSGFVASRLTLETRSQTPPDARLRVNTHSNSSRTLEAAHIERHQTIFARASRHDYS